MHAWYVGERVQLASMQMRAMISGFWVPGDTIVVYCFRAHIGFAPARAKECQELSIPNCPLGCPYIAGLDAVHCWVYIYIF